MAGQPPASPSEYIVHHLTHLNSTMHPQTKIIDMSIINWDTVFFSVAMAVLAGGLMYAAARAVSSGVPGRFVGAIESVLEFVHEQAKSIVHGDLTYIAPLALTAFMWVFFMNSLDFIPLDLFPWVAEHVLHLPYLRVVPSADLNATLAMSLMVIGSTIYYGIKVKKPGGFVHELVSAPFGTSSNPLFAIILGLLNLMMQMIEYVARGVSLGMRLFGNMFAGELVFMLIALLGATATVWGGALHFGLGLGWAIFHILIVALQAFIFMMLTLVYLGQAHDAH